MSKTKLKNRITELEKENAVLKEDNAILEDANATISKDHATLRTRIAQLESENANLQTERDFLKAFNADYADEITQLKKERDEKAENEVGACAYRMRWGYLLHRDGEVQGQFRYNSFSLRSAKRRADDFLSRHLGLPKLGDWQNKDGRVLKCSDEDPEFAVEITTD